MFKNLQSSLICCVNLTRQRIVVSKMLTNVSCLIWQLLMECLTVATPKTKLLYFCCSEKQ